MKYKSGDRVIVNSLESIKKIRCTFEYSRILKEYRFTKEREEYCEKEVVIDKVFNEHYTVAGNTMLWLDYMFKGYSHNGCINCIYEDKQTAHTYPCCNCKTVASSYYDCIDFYKPKSNISLEHTRYIIEFDSESVLNNKSLYKIKGSEYMLPYSEIKKLTPLYSSDEFKECEEDVEIPGYCERVCCYEAKEEDIVTELLKVNKDIEIAPVFKAGKVYNIKNGVIDTGSYVIKNIKSFFDLCNKYNSLFIEIKE